MWSSEDRRLRAGSLAGALAAVALLAGCQAGPLYANAGASTFRVGAPVEELQALRGRIAISEAPNRTTQTVRNPLLFRLNAGERVAQPLYRVELRVNGQDRTTSIAPAQIGAPLRSGVYEMRAQYSLVRVSDDAVIASDQSRVLVPYDETRQLYQEQRVIQNARAEAGDQAAAELELSIARALSDANPS